MRRHHVGWIQLQPLARRSARIPTIESFQWCKGHQSTSRISRSIVSSRMSMSLLALSCCVVLTTESVCVANPKPHKKKPLVPTLRIQDHWDVKENSRTNWQRDATDVHSLERVTSSEECHDTLHFAGLRRNAVSSCMRKNATSIR